MPRALFLFLILFTTAQFSWAADGRADFDLDDDGLIEIDDWSDLDEIRNNLDGTSLYGSNEGCPAAGCIGFELTTDLDFDTSGDGVLDAEDAYWNEGGGWESIGNVSTPYTGVFAGNGHIIRNLMINRPSSDSQGLFRYISDANIKELGLTGPLMAIEGDSFVGGISGYAIRSEITAVYVSGSVVGTGIKIGGLVGDMIYSEITNSYTTGSVTGDGYVGGLAGYVSRSQVTDSLSTAHVSASISGGGLIEGVFGNSVSASYWAEDVSGITNSSRGGSTTTLAQLQCPTGADNTTCAEVTLFEGWANATGAAGNAYWDFGTETELPGLVLNGTLYRDGDGDGALDADDEFPTLFAASRDSDGDGAIDRWTIGCDVECRAASGLVLDHFPDNAAAIVDTDWDGLPDQWNNGCDSACQSDSGLTLDSFPNDTDNDGIANHIDDDDNNDGIVDADANSNGLIEVATWAELDAIRYSLDGAGKKLSVDGELDTSGCPKTLVRGLLQERCLGYELVADLDFDTNGDGLLDSNDAYWNEGEGWHPIGTNSSIFFSGVFHGNGHIIRNLMINRPSSNYQGLFGYINEASVRELGLTGPLMAIEGNVHVGGISGRARNSKLAAVYASGSVVGKDDDIGGLVGSTYYTEITDSYATGSVTGDNDVGGLVGNAEDSQVTDSLSTAHISARLSAGGLIGYGYGYETSVSASYWAEDASGTTFSSRGGSSTTLAQLQCPTGADNTTCAEVTLFEAWADATDAAGNAYWDFGTETELPGLVLNGTVYRDSDGDGAQAEDDAFPEHYAASVDSDGDGAPDFWRVNCETDCRLASGLVLDKFPESAAAAVDTDGDGLPDRWNDGCDSACQSASGLALDDDNDNDGIVNVQDAFPVDAAASVDTDGDGKPDAWLEGCDSTCQSNTGLTLDEDNDNDGITNSDDAFPLNAAAAADTDSDGQPDNWLASCDSACQSASGLTLDDDIDNDGIANSEDAYPADSTRFIDEDPPEMLQTPEPISISATGASTLVTLNITQVQAVDNFDNALDFQVELDGAVLARNEEEQVSLPSGALPLQWIAVDDVGNRSEPMAQLVKVYPQVRFTQAESLSGEDRIASVGVNLSGPSPEYPVTVLVDWIASDSDATVEDVVTDGDTGVDLNALMLTITSAEAANDAALQLPIAADDLVESDERFTLELASAGAGDNELVAMPIDKDNQRHSVTITDTNVAPEVILIATQADEQGTVFSADAGNITLSAEITDVNGADSHSIQWYTSDLPVTPNDQASFTFDPQSMAPGEYSLSVVVTDNGTPVLSSEEVTFVFVLEGEDTSDGGNSGGGDTGSQTPTNPGSSSSGGSNGGSVGLWLLCLLALSGLWRRKFTM
ncbi:GLUG motif-containing protein [uncultured Microbulbifer sp.]|uniref:GLUG motif-containing protein n=1 Tax=uncultured Microbulbifer sp. TaxID=348147 RepID=UPI00262C22A9|nr:GLUG motif-containing protein [uncultured Microbulbifer sp.]